MASSRASRPPARTDTSTTGLDRIVVIAHGPSGDTLRACRSLRAAAPGVPIVVVAGTEPGAGALRRVADRGFATVDGHGPAAVAAAVASVGADEVALAVHDDVVISGRDLARMIDVHERGGQIVAPRPDGDGDDEAVAHAGTSVLVGTGAQLAEVARRGAFGPGLDLAGSFLVAGGTRVAHTGRCRTRLATPAPHRGRPLLVAAMIVRDEADDIVACIDSLAPVVDRIEIADTGSVDGTVELALGAGAHVISIDWRDDFAWARNQVLERCRDAQFVLWIDADERMRCDAPARLRQALHTFADHFAAFRARVTDVDEHGDRVADVWQTRVFRPDDVHFVGALHERVQRVDGGELVEVALPDAHLDHVGYQQGEVETEDKFERNLRLARQAFEHEPTDERRAHLFRSLGRAQVDRSQAAATLAEMDALISDFSPYGVAAQALMLTLRANVCLAADDVVEAAATARRAVELVPADRGAVAVLVEALVRQGRPLDARAAAAADATGSPEPVISHNLPAEHGIAWALLRAHIDAGDPDGALVHVGDVGASRDPWPQLLDCDGLDMVRAATAAAAAGDKRFIDELASRTVASGVLSAALEAFEASGGSSDLAGPLRRALRRAETLEMAPGLREAFFAEPSAALAVGYAKVLLEGHPDLAAELSGAEQHGEAERTIALALGIAAEAHARREDHDAAIGDAIEALGFWAGAVRAGVVAASAAVASGMADAALDIVGAVRDEVGTEDARIHDLANVAVLAHLAQGRVDHALAEAAGVLQQGGELSTWPDLIAATAGDLERFTPVLGLALTSDGKAFIEATRHTLPAENAALTCLSYLAAGGTHPDAVTTGIVTAAVDGRADVAELFLEHRDLVDPEELEGVATVLRGGGHVVVADRLGGAAR